MEHPLTAGDTIGVQLGEKKARFRVIWSINGGSLHKIQVGIELIDGQTCPWTDKLQQAPIASAKSEENKRKYVRHKIKFPVEISDERGGRAHMQTSATDISGRGCYIETMLPLPLGTNVEVTFWMDSEKVHTAGTVRASDPGVGMGIEFVGLDPGVQERFQKVIENLDPGVTDLSDETKHRL